MKDYEFLSHTKSQCKYHIIFIPKYRRRTLFGVVRRELDGVFHRLAEQKGCRIEEGHFMPDHVHMRISIAPKLAVSSVVGYPQGQEHDPRRATLPEARTQSRRAPSVADGIPRGHVGRDTEKSGAISSNMKRRIVGSTKSN